MNDDINYQHNPLHGLSLKPLLTEIVDHYGFNILYAYLNINCFKTNPSIESSIKFLKKTEWARIKVENFYLYQYKSLPRASYDQFLVPPRDRIIPEGDLPGEPAILSLEDAERLKEKRELKAAERSQQTRNKPRSDRGFGDRQNSHSSNRDKSHSSDRSSKKTTSSTTSNNADPWAKWKE